MWKRTKSAEIFQDQTKNVEVCEEFSRPYYECGSMQRVEEEFQNHTMNVETCKECRKNFNTRLKMWKCVKNAGRISIPDSQYGSLRRVQEEYQCGSVQIVQEEF